MNKEILLNKNFIPYAEQFCAECKILVNQLYMAFGLDFEEEKMKIMEEKNKNIYSHLSMQKLCELYGLNYNEECDKIYAGIDLDWENLEKLNDIPGIKSRYYSCFEPEFYGKFPKRELILIQSKGKFITEQIHENAIPCYDDNGKLIKYAICKKCNYKNEYMSHDPEYVCFNCR